MARKKRDEVRFAIPNIFKLFRPLVRLGERIIADRNKPSPEAIAGALKIAQLSAEQGLVDTVSGYYGSAMRSLLRRFDTLGRKIEVARKAGTFVNHDWLVQEGRIAVLMLQIEQRMQAASDRSATATIRAKKKAIRSGIKDSSKVIEAKVEGSFNRLPIEALDHLAARFEDGAPLRERFDRMGAEASAEAQHRLFVAVASGENPRAIVTDIAEALSTTRNNALVIARTEIITAHRNAGISNYRNNADLIVGWAWLATLDRRTCAMCVAMDGSEHDIGEGFESHPVCRCTTVPIMRGEKYDGTDRGSNWFDTQPPDVKTDVLGSKLAYSLFRLGVIGLKDFIEETVDPKYGRGRRRKNVKKMLAEGIVSSRQVVTASELAKKR